MSSIIEEINRYLPSDLNKTTDIHKAWFGDEEANPPFLIDDVTGQRVYQYGALANELERLEDFIDQVTTTIELEDFTNRYLEIIAELFLGFEREFNEDDASLRRKIIALLRRGKQDSTEFDNASWDTEFSMLEVLGNFLDRANLFIEAIPNGANLVSDFDFAGVTHPDWEYRISSSNTVVPIVIDNTDIFMSGAAALIEADHNLRQRITLPADERTYYTSAFVYPKSFTDTFDFRIAVQRKDDSRWYNTDTLEWQVGFAFRTQKITHGSFNYVESFWEVEAAVGSIDVEVLFIVPAGAYTSVTLDRVIAAERHNYPTVNILARADTIGAEVFWGLEGNADPIPGVNYEEHVAYLDNSYLSISVGSTAIYDDIIQIIKMAGCQVTIGSVTRE